MADVEKINGFDICDPVARNLAGGAPVGSVTAFMGTTIPDGWLLCNGQTFDTSVYPDLYAVLGSNRVPDLRGEFLRGAGTNSHYHQGNGGTVGEHQQSTRIPLIVTGTAGEGLYFNIRPGNENYVEYPDNSSAATQTGRSIVSTTRSDDGNLAMNYTVRPTNTSVNYIICAKYTAGTGSIGQQIEALNNDIANIKRVTTYNGTPNSNLAGGSYCSAKVKNGVACVTISFLSSTVLNANTTIFSGLPHSAYYINTPLISDSLSSMDGVYHNGVAYLSPYGELITAGALKDGEWYRGSTAYIVS